MTSSNALIDLFDNVSKQKRSLQRNIDKNAVVDKMNSLLENSNEKHDIEILINSPNKSLGKIVFCIVLIRAKAQDYNNAYNGPTITRIVFNFLVENTTHTSDYIKELSRQVILFIIKRNLFTQKQIARIRKYVTSYPNTSNDTENIERYEWTYNVLLETCPEVNQDDLLGCMIGKCVGNAIGLQVNGCGADVCKEYADVYVSQIRVPTNKMNGVMFGQYADDSQMSRELLLTIVETDGILDAEIYARRMALLCNPDRHTIVTYSTINKQAHIQALESIWNGAIFTKTGCPFSHDCGSVMRSAPIGVLFSSYKAKDVVKMTHELSSITHSRHRCMAGAAAISLAAKYIVACKQIGYFDIKQFSKFIANTGDKQLDVELTMLPDIVDWTEEEAFDYIVRLGVFDGESKWKCSKGFTGISDDVTQIVLWSLYCFCKHPTSFVNCISTAISVGGYVKTTASIAGALVGIWVGIDSIPLIWKCKINDKNEWNYNKMCHLVSNTVYTINKCIPRYKFVQS